MFRVWAPRAATVELWLDGSTMSMRGLEGGWWSSDATASPGADYAYLLDSDPTPLPDPRSRWQPAGVHGPSRVDDHEEPESWPGRELAGGVIYELHVGTFTTEGTLDSAIGRLDHLVELGIDFIELLPVNAFNGRWNWGYDGELWYAVQQSYGGPAAYRRFVRACHHRGLAVIQDVVYNHLGPSGNPLPRFGPYLVEGSTNTWGEILNLAEPEVRNYIIDNALMWLRDYGVDALRLDAVHALVDPTERHILEEIAEAVDALALELGRPLSLIAESDLNDPHLVTPRIEGGYGLTAQWSDDYHHALHVALTGETAGYYADFDGLAALGKVTKRGFFHDGTWSSFRGRRHGIPIDTDRVPPWRLISYAQDHDQVGNRAAGDRLSATVDSGALAIAAVMGLISPFTPMLFMGEEWGASTPWQFFTSHPEPELGRATAQGRLAEFTELGWDPADVPDPQDPETFRRSTLDWAEPHAPDHAWLLALYTRLIRLRREYPGLSEPRFDSIRCDWDEDRRWFRLERRGISVVVNFSWEERALNARSATRVLLATGDARLGRDFLVVARRSAVIVATG